MLLCRLGLSTLRSAVARHDAPSCAPGVWSAQVPKHLLPVTDLQSERKNDLSLGIHSAAFTALNPIDGEHRDASSPRKLGLGHQLIFSQAPHVV